MGGSLCPDFAQKDVSMSIKDQSGAYDTTAHVLRIHYNSQHTLTVKDKTEWPLYYPDKQDIQFLTQLTTILRHRYIDSMFDVEILSASLYLSKMQAYRRIKSETGLAPGALLLRFRLVNSLDLLLNTNICIGEIAHASGFNSHNNFSRSFRKVLWHCPRELKFQYVRLRYNQANNSYKWANLAPENLYTLQLLGI
jgi:transcriptional regulator GlxA family with amidase domain